MTVDELRAHLRHLIDTYLSDRMVRADLHSLVAMHDVPAKAVLAELEAARSGTMSEADARLVKEIAFYFC